MVEDIFDPWSSLFDDDIIDEKDVKPVKEQEVVEDDLFDDEEESGEDNTSFYLELTKTLKDKSILEIDDEDLNSIEDEEDFKEVLGKVIDKKVDEELTNWLSSFDDDAKKLIEDLSKGKKLKDLLLSVDEYDLDNPKDQEKLIRDYFREINMDPDEIDDNIALYKDLDTLQSKAKNIKPKLDKIKESKEANKIEIQKQEELKREEQRQEVIKDIKNKIVSAEEIKGFPITEKDRNNLIDYITNANVKYKDPVTGKTSLITKYQADEIERSKDMDVFLLKALQSMKNYSLDPVKKKAITENTSKIEEKYKKMVESDTQAKFKQTNTRQLKEDPFEKYLKNNK